MRLAAPFLRPRFEVGTCLIEMAVSFLLAASASLLGALCWGSF